MKNITQLVKALSPREVKLFKRYNALGAKSGDTLKNKLFDIILKNDELSDIEAAKKLGKKHNSSFIMLKRRLEEDIIKFLFWDHEPIITSSKAVKARRICRLLMLTVEILWSKGLYTLGDQKLLKAERLAKKYELTQDTILIQELLGKAIVPKETPKFYKKFKESSLREFQMIKDKFEAQDHYRQLTRPIHFSAKRKQNFVQQAAESVNQLSILKEKNLSAEVELYYIKSQVYYNHVINKYEESKKFLLQELEFVKSNLKILASDYIPSVYYRLSIISIYMGDFDYAIESANLGIKYFYKESNNHLILNVCLFQSYFYKGEYEKLKQLIEETKNFKIVKPGSFNYYIWLYYEAILNFKLGNYKTTLKILERNSDLTADKTGWRVGYKILEMMCIIEMKNYDWLDYRIEAFRKLIRGIKNENMARPNVVYELIKKLIKENYNFNITTQKNKSKLALLKSNSDEYQWEARGYELIRFDEWWKTKLAASKSKKALEIGN